MVVQACDGTLVPEEEISDYFAFDSSILSGIGLKRKLIIKDLDFFGPYLLLTVSPTVC